MIHADDPWRLDQAGVNPYGSTYVACGGRGHGGTVARAAFRAPVAEFRVNGPVILTYCPFPYNGRGPARTCVEILQNFPPDMVSSRLVVPRARAPVARMVQLEQALEAPLRWAPWKLVEGVARARTDQAFAKALEEADPDNTIAYFWPEPPPELILHAKARGIVTVREMINCFTGVSRSILDRAYALQNMPPGHGLTEIRVERERRELQLYDYIFTSPQVVPTLRRVPIDPGRILTTGFGWSPARLAGSAASQPDQYPTFLFVGTVCIRKGAPQLLEAWRRCGVVGRLVIAGDIDAEMARIIKPYRADSSIEFVAYTRNVSDLYRRADVFVMPTFEEGGPLVVFEAAASGLPIITTRMGGAVAQHGVNALIVDAADVAGLAAAMSILGASKALRDRFGTQSLANAADHTFAKVAADRARAFVDMLSPRRRRGGETWFGYRH